MVPETPRRGNRPNHYVCPCCHLYLLSWDAPTQTVDMFHKVGLWEDSFTHEVRLICQYCLGATEVLPDPLVQLLRVRFGLSALPTGPFRPTARR